MGGRDGGATPEGLQTNQWSEQFLLQPKRFLVPKMVVIVRKYP